MNRLVLTGMVAITAFSAMAMPTKQDLAKAGTLVAELMADDVEAFKAKSKTAVQVADASVGYADRAETEAAKFLLLKGAITYYVKGDEYDKAADIALKLKNEIKEVPPSVLAEILGKATSRITSKKAPKLYSVYNTVRIQAKAQEDVAAMKKKLSKVNSDAVRLQYAEAVAVSGDWKTALEEFAKTKHEVSQIAKSELEGKAKSDEAGEFWWSYKVSYPDAEETVRAHAAALYRKALAAGEISGLREDLIKKRIEDYPELAVNAPVVQTAVNSPVRAGVKRVAPPDLSPGKVPDAKAFDLGDGVKLELVGCPAGEFTMGCSGDAKRIDYKHKVKITRHFWISKYQVTARQFEKFKAIDNQLKSSAGEQGGGDIPVNLTLDLAREFCANLNRKFKSSLPEGYVFRFPTDAEWEYALRANATDEKDLYVRMLGGDDSAVKECLSEYKAVFKGMSPAGSGPKANAWGLSNMLGNGLQFVLDTVDESVVREYQGMNSPDKELRGARGTATLDNERGGFVYAAEEVDPLHGDGVGRFALARGMAHSPNKASPAYARFVQTYLNKYYAMVMWTVRICLGPDLVSEKNVSNAPVKVDATESQGGLTVSAGASGDIEFVKCPAGKVSVQLNNKKDAPGIVKEVDIQRPFWIVRSCLNASQIKTLGGGSAFGSKVLELLGNKVPKDYVVRRPTLAEIEYVFKNKTNKFGLGYFGKGVRLVDRLMDTDLTFWDRKKHPQVVIQILGKPCLEANGLFYADNDDAFGLSRMFDWGGGWAVHPVKWDKGHASDGDVIVIGPDVVSEWKARNGKK